MKNNKDKKPNAGSLARSNALHCELMENGIAKVILVKIEPMEIIMQIVLISNVPKIEFYPKLKGRNYFLGIGIMKLMAKETNTHYKMYKQNLRSHLNKQKLG